MVESIAPGKRHAVRALFDQHRQWRAFIESVVGSGLGFLYADLAEPTAAVLSFSGAVVYGGDPSSSVAMDLVRQIAYQPMVLATHESWNQLIYSAGMKSIVRRDRYFHRSEDWDPNRMQTPELPEGYVCRRIAATDDKALFDRLGWEHQKYHFASIQAFVDEGLGFCILKDGQICSAISAFARFQRDLDRSSSPRARVIP